MSFEPVVCGQFWKNRAGQALRVELLEFEGRPCVDIRIWSTDRSGVMRPARGGVCLSAHHLPKLVAALLAAQRKSEELGLLPAATAAESRVR